MHYLVYGLNSYLDKTTKSLNLMDMNEAPVRSYTHMLIS